MEATGLHPGIDMPLTVGKAQSGIPIAPIKAQIRGGAICVRVFIRIDSIGMEDCPCQKSHCLNRQIYRY